VREDPCVVGLEPRMTMQWKATGKGQELEDVLAYLETITG
jgi:hypothetical protein